MPTYLEKKEKELIASLKEFQSQWESLPKVIADLREAKQRAEETLQDVVDGYGAAIDRACRYTAKLEMLGKTTAKFMAEYHDKKEWH